MDAERVPSASSFRPPRKVAKSGRWVNVLSPNDASEKAPWCPPCVAFSSAPARSCYRLPFILKIG
jgi:hypothetical protein